MVYCQRACCEHNPELSIVMINVLLWYSIFTGLDLSLQFSIAYTVEPVFFKRRNKIRYTLLTRSYIPSGLLLFLLNSIVHSFVVVKSLVYKRINLTILVIILLAYLTHKVFKPGDGTKQFSTSVWTIHICKLKFTYKIYLLRGCKLNQASLLKLGDMYGTGIE